jgi:hypothetical protein
VYRDVASNLDEHDRAVGSILIVEQLVDECEREAATARRTEVAQAARWQAIGRLHDGLRDTWRLLERARADLVRRGANTVAYDELSPHARRAATNVGSDGALDTRALEDARAALESLKLAVPGTDWRAIATRTQGLVDAPIGRRRRQRWPIAAGVFGLVLVLVTWGLAIRPVHKRDPRAAMRQELSQIADQRKIKIAELQVMLGADCLPAQAHELVRLLVLDGRVDDARTFGDGYETRCGDDEVVEHWANAPRPPIRY